MSYTYSTFVTALSVEVNIPATNTGFVAILPTIIDQAEQQIYRDLDLIATVRRDNSGTTTPASRNFTLPTSLGRFVVLQDINLLNGGDRTPLVKLSRPAMDWIWPSDTPTGAVPKNWAPVTDQLVLIGPAPNSAFNLECVGTIRPEALSASNTETFLSTQLPDLFLAAALVNASGYMRNFGAQADDPKMALSWSDRYAALVKSANAEELRRKYDAAAGGA